MTPAFGGIGLDSPPFSQPLLFAVSADQTVTSISIGYKYAGCSGTKTLSGLSIPIGVSIFKPELQGWTYESAPPGDPNRAQFWSRSGLTSKRMSRKQSWFQDVATPTPTGFLRSSSKAGGGEEAMRFWSRASLGVMLYLVVVLLAVRGNPFLAVSLTTPGYFVVVGVLEMMPRETTNWVGGWIYLMFLPLSAAVNVGIIVSIAVFIRRRGGITFTRLGLRKP